MSVVLILGLLVLITAIVIAFQKGKDMEKIKAEKIKKKSGKGKKIIISIGIAILFVMFVAYAVESIYPSPKWEDYCNPMQKEILTQEECVINNGTWTPQDIQCIKAPCPQGYCDTYTRCSNELQKVTEVYNRNVFFVSLALGIIVLLVSFIPAVETVSLGFMAGSLLLIIYGTIRYWGNLSNIWKTIMIGLALGVLIWISYKKLK